MPGLRTWYGRLVNYFLNNKIKKGMTHALKTSPEFFQKILDNNKNFELRKIDRPFKNGDKLLLQEYSAEAYTGRELELYITDVFAGADAETFGLRKGFGILSFDAKKVEPYFPKDCNNAPIRISFAECKPVEQNQAIDAGSSLNAIPPPSVFPGPSF